jgi:5-methylcytosine-specific restriction endonuclease McrA
MCRVISKEPTSGAEWKGTNARQNKRRRRAYTEGDKIDPYVVYSHFDWICQLCHEDINPELRLPEKMAATLDHIIPLCQGGTHTWDNVQPAHAICNFIKANKQ